MCGIFGILAKDSSCFSPSMLEYATNHLFLLSESRGREASGISLVSEDSINIYKEPVPASVLIHRKGYKKLFTEILSSNELSTKSGGTRSPVAIVGHSRLVTNGCQEINSNNQPVVANGLVGVHNGIIVNDDALWNQYPAMQKKYEVDSEVILRLIEMFHKDGASLSYSVQATFNNIQGSASIAVLTDNNRLILATNTGSLYMCNNSSGNTVIFASERYILETILKKRKLRNILGRYKVERTSPNRGCIIDLPDLSIECFGISANNGSPAGPAENNRLITLDIIDHSPKLALRTADIQAKHTIHAPKHFSAVNDDFEPTVRRCTTCILPETVPFIEFDDRGVCNTCNSYRKIETKGEKALEDFVNPYRSNTRETDCIVMFSGGRDSTYCLHYIKNILKMNPLAYSYDWGMLSDLGRRNQARICGKLGIEHIIISADIKKKRNNIRKNIEAWLKKPDLGIIPLFMAGDKQYFYYANQLRKQTQIKLIFHCRNQFEWTNFKYSFSGIDDGRDVLLNRTWNKQIKLAKYYLKEFLVNPSYLNDSIVDTLFGFYSYYMINHDFLPFFDYIKWDENKISHTLVKEYAWEVAADTKSTWRIGDGTTSFYNYIYYTVAGFTEIDTFRSNQIREGIISREKALELVHEENRPRYDSLQWYADIIGFNLEETLNIINSIPKLYTLPR